MRSSVGCIQYPTSLESGTCGLRIHYALCSATAASQTFYKGWPYFYSTLGLPCTWCEAGLTLHDFYLAIHPISCDIKWRIVVVYCVIWLKSGPLWSILSHYTVNISWLQIFMRLYSIFDMFKMLQWAVIIWFFRINTDKIADWLTLHKIVTTSAL